MCSVEYSQRSRPTTDSPRYSCGADIRKVGDLSGDARVPFRCRKILDRGPVIDSRKYEDPPPLRCSLRCNDNGVGI